MTGKLGVKTIDAGVLTVSCLEDGPPNWRFDEATFERTAASFDNPDFVDVVIHPTATPLAWPQATPPTRNWSSGSPAGPRSSCRR